ncbi:MAG TPA: glycosyl transferase [Chloroflexus aurantiacus]|jgi:exopolysaccharide biosynthesis polyprenyl glycosylphosphotransferase|uniref:Undecaprenyl-phosphate galactose phosphotransferase n=1 Tax=Chloroflexus aurantiacus (strain ATCC 29366 / DSM 635 / J-10-fl) TaxID=324602 RepID=A9WAE4_CHLAA|nr:MULTISPECIES: exopolysaccharide biosynthesis polyprenyl glycosylphosphotransferase [Chloroflexus]ABY34703.1 Undecaprenyl-phosphate galactose phosphotransferase [Chloroflexus aurantiacus J-10-fl]RMG46975.1 MAG: exopolysaccharide biosynthesis polyprenyl glycosylphosphotransferase [Chloroflexota bacterium]HBW67337.1 glycosyl transferase [Chloroflexus aurantiacus]
MNVVKPKSHHLDNKTERMLTIFAERRFQRTRANQRLRLALSWWVIRTKLLSRLKRVLDVTVAVIAIILTSPIMLMTALLIKLESPGPVIFKQVRVGKDGEHFYCYKFRSMYVDAEQRLRELQAKNEADGPVFKMKRDPRVTRVGRVIRKLSIDELPQLFNVLKGEMSLVGPRPALPSEVAKYTYEQIGRLHAIPGITGLQQVSGRSDLDFKRWVELDLQYIAEQSIWKDIEILLRTIPAVLLGRGAY